MKTWLSVRKTLLANFVLLVALMSTVSTTEECHEYENKLYTYRVCPDTGIRNFNRSREHCQSWHPSADLMTFPTEQQFEFIKRIMNETAYLRSPNTPQKQYAFIGVYQRQNHDKVFNPETGEFYWVTKPQHRITNKSGDFYYPFAGWIDFFNESTLVRKHRQTLILSSEGDVFGGTSFGQHEVSENIENLILICSRLGASEIEKKPRVDNETSDDSLVKLIAIIAGSVVGLLCLILVIAFVCRKCDQGGSHLFSKVPQQELTPTNSTYAHKV